ncbi:hypothetical protein [Senegalia sp. (in: firmicutes)]|uniref:hypothetical protein n=1 Tax=Senegalia sp. (in: firmicutes) TaxID=1924098 RepID=UPI003F9672E9
MIIYYIFFFIISITIIIPLYIFLIYSLIHPEKTMFMGSSLFIKNKDLEPTEFALDRYKFGIILTLILTTIFIISIIYQLVK